MFLLRNPTESLQPASRNEGSRLQWHILASAPLVSNGEGPSRIQMSTSAQQSTLSCCSIRVQSTDRGIKTLVNPHGWVWSLTHLGLAEKFNIWRPIRPSFQECRSPTTSTLHPHSAAMPKGVRWHEINRVPGSASWVMTGGRHPHSRIQVCARCHTPLG